MKESVLFAALKQSVLPAVPPCYKEGGITVCKLEGYIEGKQADLTRKLLENRQAENYQKDLIRLVEMENESGIVYDVSPSLTKEKV